MIDNLLGNPHSLALLVRIGSFHTCTVWFSTLLSFPNLSQIASRCGLLQTMMQHCWPSAGSDIVDVSLKWPPCKIANTTQISPVKCGPPLATMCHTQLIWIVLDLRDRAVAQTWHTGVDHSTAINRTGSGPQQFCYLG